MSKIRSVKVEFVTDRTAETILFPTGAYYDKEIDMFIVDDVDTGVRKMFPREIIQSFQTVTESDDDEAIETAEEDVSDEV